MAKTFDDCLKAIQDILGRVEGVRSAPEYASDKVPIGIFSLAFPVTGTFDNDPPGVLKGLHDAGAYILVPRSHLVATLKAIIPVGEKAAAALENEPTLLGTCDTFGEISYRFHFALNVGTPREPAYVTGWEFTISQIKIEDETALA